MAKDKLVRIAFNTNGGAGTLFVHMNFIYSFWKYISDEHMQIIVFGHKSDNLNRLVFEGQPCITEYYNTSESSHEFEYDACIHLNFFPEVIYANVAIVKQIPKLQELLDVWKKFLDVDPFRRYTIVQPDTDVNAYIYALNNGKCYLNVLDVNSVMKVSANYSWHLKVKNIKQTLHQYNLEENQYITLQTGATPAAQSKQSPKTWRSSYFEELVRLIKVSYPNKKIVQLGEKNNSVIIKGVDICLIGKTNWNQLAGVLKGAWLHIDGECGMVHLREVVKGGTSVVLFGPTPKDFYGYKNNINLHSDTCVGWCARITDRWLRKCEKTGNIPACMDALKPYYVMSKIIEWDCMNKIKEGTYEGGEKVFVNEKLKNEKGIIIDSDFYEKYIDTRKIYHYEVQRVLISKLLFLSIKNTGIEYIPIQETAAYQMACGNSRAYQAYVDFINKKFNDNIHSVKRFMDLIKKLNEQEYDDKWIIVADPDYKVMDGQHRAAWLAEKYGVNHIVSVLLIYKMDDEKWDFLPFEKIERASHVAIYGAGSVGKSYIEQLVYTKYCKVQFMIDQNANEWNYGLNRKKYNIECITPQQIHDNKKKVDYFIIASRNDKNSKDMYDLLLENGIIASQIISEYNFR